MGSNTIEVNGKRYDARTGKVLSAHHTVQAGGTNVVKPVTNNPGVVLDGFSRRRQPAAPSKVTAKAVHKTPERSKTLMRTAVKKPTAAKNPQATVSKRRQPHAAAHEVVDKRRVNRAQEVKKSNLVSRFGVPQAAVKPFTSVLPVRNEPTPPNPLFNEHLKPSIPSETNNHLANALKHAKSHEQPRAHKVTRRHKVARKLRVSTRTLNVAAGTMAFVLLGGFFAYQNVPNFSMQVASARAGIDGRLPEYQPSGFGLSGPISYQQGKITLNFASRADDRGFNISQQASQWNSDSLLENYVAVDGKQYQTFKDGGKTIYVFDQSNATWVDGGVWYQIEGNSSLSSDQLLRMASSM